MNSTTLKNLLILICPLSAAQFAGAALLVDWNLDTVTGPTENNTPFAGVASTVASVASNATVSDLLSMSSAGHSGLFWSAGNPGPGKLNFQRWDHPNDNPSLFGNGNGNPNNWLQFTITADPGFLFTLQSIDFAAWRNGAGAPADWTFQYDTGTGWTTFGTSHTEANAGDSVFRNVEYIDSVTATSMDIRFIATGPTGGTGNIHINRMVLNGEVAVIPEPSAAMLGGLGLLALLRRRR